MRLGHLSRLLLGPFSLRSSSMRVVGETGGGAPLNILALDSEVGYWGEVRYLESLGERKEFDFVEFLHLMDRRPVRDPYVYIYIRKASCRGKEFVKFFTAAVRYGSTSRVDPCRLRDFVIHACLCPLSLFSPCEHSTGIVGGTADEMR